MNKARIITIAIALVGCQSNTSQQKSNSTTTPQHSQLKDTTSLTSTEFLIRKDALTASYDTIRKITEAVGEIKFGDEPDIRVTQIDDKTFFVDNYFEYENKFKVSAHQYYSCYVIFNKGVSQPTISKLKIRK